MKERHPWRLILILLFVAFLTLYISQATGYYDYRQYQKTEITADKMKQFEKDIKDGKKIDITDYMTDTTHNYNNDVSQAGLKLSGFFKKYIKQGIGGAFKLLDKLLNTNE